MAADSRQQEAIKNCKPRAAMAAKQAAVEQSNPPQLAEAPTEAASSAPAGSHASGPTSLTEGAESLHQLLGALPPQTWWKLLELPGLDTGYSLRIVVEVRADACLHEPA
jgi:hypothetical protein